MATKRTVAGYQHFPPCAVGTLSALSPEAMAAHVAPEWRDSTIRETTSDGRLRGRPRRTPWALRTARAAFVLSPMSRRSNSAKTANTCAMAAPCGVVVSTGASRATSPHPDCSALAMRPVASCTDRVSLSSFATISTEPSPVSRLFKAVSSAGRFNVFAERPASVRSAIKSRPLRSHSRLMACSWAANPSPETACSSVLTRQ